MPAIPAKEIADLLRAVVRRERKVSLADPDLSWDKVYAGDVPLKIAGYDIVIFNDCDEVDYVDSAASPDKRIADFDDWFTTGANPIDLLQKEECDALLQILKQTA